MTQNDFSDVKVGDFQVSKLMFGDDLIWDKSPSGVYEELEWISNHGLSPNDDNKRPYVETDIYLNAFTDVMEIDAKFNPPTSKYYDNIPFGCASPRATDPAGRGQISYAFCDNAGLTNNARYYRYYMFYGTYGGGNYNKHRCKFEITIPNDREARMLIRMAPSPSITINGHMYTPSTGDYPVDVYTFEPEDFTITAPLAIFSYTYMNPGKEFLKSFREWTFYGCKIYRSGALIHNLVPARRLSDGEVGIYNKSTGAFYENLGDIPFTTPS